MSIKYLGCRAADGDCIVCVLSSEDVPLRYLTPEQSLKVRNHSPTGFNWGYEGSGPAQLALAIMLDHLIDARDAQSVYQKFKRDHVASWQADEWCISNLEIDEWLQRRRPDWFRLLVGGEV